MESLAFTVHIWSIGVPAGDIRGVLVLLDAGFTTGNGVPKDMGSPGGDGRGLPQIYRGMETNGILYRVNSTPRRTNQ